MSKNNHELFKLSDADYNDIEKSYRHREFFSYKLSIYVPATYGGKPILPVHHIARAYRVADNLAEIFGGATTIGKGEGFWYDDDSKLVSEDSIIVQAIASETNTTLVHAIAHCLCNVYKRDWRQDCVLFDVVKTSAVFV